MELSIRLKTVAEAVTKGNRVADVGTDHGYVPIYLVKNNLSPDTVIIAGMGGDLICKILKAKPEFLIEGKEFILQPQSEWFKIRRLLKEYRYQIEKEWFLKEDGKYYVIIKAEPAWTQPQRLKHQQPSIHEYIKEISDTQVNQAVSEKDMESIYEQYGKYLIETKNPVLKEYLEKEITKKESIAAELKQSIKEIESEELSGKERGNIAKRQRRYQEIQKEIRDMRKAIG